MEQDAERKIGWLLKLIFAGTATVVAYQFFPYMGMWMSLLKDIQKPYIDKISAVLQLLPDKIMLIHVSGDNLMQQSVSLLHVKDPLFKRMGASRLARFAVDGNFDINIMPWIWRKLYPSFSYF